MREIQHRDHLQIVNLLLQHDASSSVSAAASSSPLRIASITGSDGVFDQPHFAAFQRILSARQIERLIAEPQIGAEAQRLFLRLGARSQSDAAKQGDQQGKEARAHTC